MSSSDAILSAKPLGFPWQPRDPFLFCVHHDDRYPRATSGWDRRRRSRGATSARTSRGKDGWRMYHGEVVPGFPQHPHRGFETVTIVAPRAHRPLRLARRGRALRPGRRAVADRGRRHRARRDVPAARRERPNPLELFPDLAQPAGRRQDGRAALLDALERDDPAARGDRRARAHDRGHGRRRRSSATARAAPPPHSWAARPTPTSRSGRSSWRRGATWTLPPAPRRHEPRRSTSSAGERLRVGGRDARERARASRVRADARRRRSRPATRRVELLAAAGPADRRAGRAVRPVRDEHARRDRAGVRRLPADAVRRLALAERRSGARARRGRFARTPTAAPSAPAEHGGRHAHHRVPPGRRGRLGRRSDLPAVTSSTSALLPALAAPPMGRDRGGRVPRGLVSRLIVRCATRRTKRRRQGTLVVRAA